MNLNIYHKIIFMAIFISLVSCFSGSDKITNEIIGTYVFKFPSGEYELLKINKDSTYIQKYYKDFNSFESGKNPIYFNKGKWSTTDKFELCFNNWLEYCYLSNPDSILATPEHHNRLNVYWFKASSNSKEIISIYSENNYNFEKIDSLSNW